MKKLPLLLLVIVISCSKQDIGSDCERLKSGVNSNNIESVGASINNFIAGLGSKAHTSENLTALAKKVSAKCDVEVEVLCYACIMTLPEQSELRVTLSSAGSTITKVIDISQNSSNEMKFVNMHD
jgi:hypothetical protein